MGDGDIQKKCTNYFKTTELLYQHRREISFTKICFVTQDHILFLSAMKLSQSIHDANNNKEGAHKNTQLDKLIGVVKIKVHKDNKVPFKTL